jgi:hypothetical protein
MFEHDDPTQGEATGDEQAIEDPTREPSAPLDERVPHEQTSGRRRRGAEESERGEPTRDAHARSRLHADRKDR